jgi:hypothetical protein
MIENNMKIFRVMITDHSVVLISHWFIPSDYLTNCITLRGQWSRGYEVAVYEPIVFQNIVIHNFVLLSVSGSFTIVLLLNVMP